MQNRATPFSAAIAGFVLGFGLVCHEELGLPSFLRASAVGNAIEILAAVLAFAMFYLFVLGIHAPFERTWFLDREESKRHHVITQRMLVAFLAAGVGGVLAVPLCAMLRLLVR